MPAKQPQHLQYFIRVDASNEIGTGHVMRCLTLAKKLPSKAIFICATHQSNLSEYIKEQGYQVKLITPNGKLNINSKIPHANWLGGSPENDAEQTNNILSKHSGFCSLIIDHYAIDKNWQNLVGNANQIIIIDDLADRQHNCNLLLDANLYKNAKSRYNSLTNKYCKLLLGANFVLLRDEFYKANKNPRKELKNILIFFGGIDKKGHTLSVIKELKISGKNVKVLVGKLNPFKDKIKQICEEKNFVYLEHTNNIASLMTWADLAIGAGGTTTWERASLGLPCITYCIAKNQEQLVKDAASFGIIYAATNNINQDITNAEKQLENISSKCLKLVKADGTHNVIQEIKNLPIICSAKLDDARAVFELRNQDEVCEVSISKNKINWHDHSKWFAAKLTNNLCQIYLLKIADICIGCIRFEKQEKDQWEVSLFLDIKHSGKGYGSLLLQQATRLMIKDYKATQFTANILQNNVTSNSLFNKHNYKLIKTAENINFWSTT